ncbi:MAG TPA: ATP-binding cassette domain-containing protein [Solirubrobacteraceae bacterium]|nr:ATP-binding cassette domain-containing protein [Solirubrobacteraceae bacterium]
MSALLSVERVFKSHWRGAHETAVLADVSLEVNAGEFFAIWGQRGAGKTTLAMVAAGLVAPDRGCVSFDGHVLGGVPRGREPHLHDGVGWVQRNGPHSEVRSIVEYVALPLLGKLSPRNARRRASAILKRFGVADCAYESWEGLTDGERTLVALARALVREPKLLIADDPTTNLDVLQREEIMRLLRHAATEEGLGILVTVPDMPDMAHADRMGSLSDGRLIVSGTPQDLRTNVVALRGRQQSA